MNYKVYEDDKGNILRVSSGISQGDSWMTVRSALHSIGSHLVKSKALPVRDDRGKAQEDLDAWAKVKNLREICTVGDGDGTA